MNKYEIRIFKEISFKSLTKRKRNIFPFSNSYPYTIGIINSNKYYAIFHVIVV